MKKLVILFIALAFSAVQGHAQTACTAGYTYTQAGADVTFANTSTGSYSDLYYDFGDGQYSSNPNVTHTYAPGLYLACITVSDSNSNCYDWYCDSIYVAGSGGCNASFVFYPDSSGGFDFDASASSGAAPIIYTWDFGDGNIFTATNPYYYHAYNAPGTYNVCLTISDNNNCSSTTCSSVTVAGGGGCNASFQVYPDSLPGDYYFAGTATGVAPFTYFWDFGDGTTGTTSNAFHTYTSPGTYTACLTISDAVGCTSTSCNTVTYTGGGGGCGVSFVAVQDSSGGYNLVTTVTGSGPYAYFWDFGDGFTSTASNPSHTYLQTGAYVICVTISDNANCTATHCDSLWVLGGSNVSSSIMTGQEEVALIQQNRQLYPNPTSGNAWMEVSALESTQTTIRIFNTSGQLVSNTAATLAPGQNKIEIATDGLSEGLYLLRLEAGNSTITQSFIKK